MSSNNIFGNFTPATLVTTSGGRFVFKFEEPTVVGDGPEPFAKANGLPQGCAGDPDEARPGDQVLLWGMKYDPGFEFPLARHWAIADARTLPAMVYAKLVACADRAGDDATDFLVAIANLVREPLFRGTYSSFRGTKPLWQTEADETVEFFLGELTHWFEGDNKGKVKFALPFEASKVRSDVVDIRGQGHVSYMKPGSRQRQFNPRIGSTILAWIPVGDGDVIRMLNWAPVTISRDLALSCVRIISAYMSITPEERSELITQAAQICAQALIDNKAYAFKSKKGNGKGEKGNGGNGNLQTAPAAPVAAQVEPSFAVLVEFAPEPTAPSGRVVPVATAPTQGALAEEPAAPPEAGAVAEVEFPDLPDELAKLPDACEIKEQVIATYLIGAATDPDTALETAMDTLKKAGWKWGKIKKAWTAPKSKK